MEKKTKKRPRFKKIETGYHKGAVNILCEWVNGKPEIEFKIEGQVVFVADVAVYSNNNILQSIYEVYYSHPLNGKKLGFIQEWCYRNSTTLTVFEISADYILAQTEKPDPIIPMECFMIDPFENNYDFNNMDDIRD